MVKSKDFIAKYGPAYFLLEELVHYTQYLRESYNDFMPTVLKLKGFRFFFFSNETNEPVHIHVESDEKYAKFWLEPLQLAKSVGYSAQELSEIRNLILKNINMFRRKWDEHFSH